METIQIMDWTQVLTIVGSNIALILLMFGTSVGIWLHTDKKIESNRKEASEIMRAIVTEMKDFHGKICQIEERNKGK